MAFPLGVLALLAVLSFWVEQTVRHPEKHAKIETDAADYYLQDFVTSKTDANGDLKFMLAAKEMRHFVSEDKTTLLRPKFTQYGKNQPYTQIEGQKGQVSHDGEVVDIEEHVVVVRQATAEKGQMRMTTDALKLYPNHEFAVTDRPVEIQQAPATVIHAHGLALDKKAQTLNLFNRVKVHYQPNKSGRARNVKAGKKAASPIAQKSEVRKAAEKPISKKTRRVRRKQEHAG